MLRVERTFGEICSIYCISSIANKFNAYRKSAKVSDYRGKKGFANLFQLDLYAIVEIFHTIAVKLNRF